MLTRIDMGDFTLQDVLSSAEASPKTWDCACELVNIHTQSHKVLPNELSEFITKAARGIIQRPRRAGRKHDPTRDYIVVKTIIALLDKFPDLRATRNESHRSNESACSVVAAAMMEIFKVGTGEEAIAKVWKRYKSNEISDHPVVSFALDCFPRK